MVRRWFEDDSEMVRREYKGGTEGVRSPFEKVAPNFRRENRKKGWEQYGCKQHKNRTKTGEVDEGKTK